VRAGGKGCRDRFRMAKNDARKHKGLNKTISRKAAAKKKS